MAAPTGMVPACSHKLTYDRIADCCRNKCHSYSFTILPSGYSECRCKSKTGTSILLLLASSIELVAVVLDVARLPAVPANSLLLCSGPTTLTSRLPKGCLAEEGRKLANFTDLLVLNTKQRAQASIHGQGPVGLTL
jgi:hypothetical protein